MQSRALHVAYASVDQLAGGRVPTSDLFMPDTMNRTRRSLDLPLRTSEESCAYFVDEANAGSLDEFVARIGRRRLVTIIPPAFASSRRVPSVCFDVVALALDILTSPTMALVILETGNVIRFTDADLDALASRAIAAAPQDAAEEIAVLYRRLASPQYRAGMRLREAVTSIIDPGQSTTTSIARSASLARPTSSSSSSSSTAQPSSAFERAVHGLRRAIDTNSTGYLQTALTEPGISQKERDALRRTAVEWAVENDRRSMLAYMAQRGLMKDLFTNADAFQEDEFVFKLAKLAPYADSLKSYLKSAKPGPRIFGSSGRVPSADGLTNIGELLEDIASKEDGPAYEATRLFMDGVDDPRLPGLAGWMFDDDDDDSDGASDAAAMVVLEQAAKSAKTKTALANGESKSLEDFVALADAILRKPEPLRGRATDLLVLLGPRQIQQPRSLQRQQGSRRRSTFAQPTSTARTATAPSARVRRGGPLVAPISISTAAGQIELVPRGTQMSGRRRPRAVTPGSTQTRQVRQRVEVSLPDDPNPPLVYEQEVIMPIPPTGPQTQPSGPSVFLEYNPLR